MKSLVSVCFRGGDERYSGMSMQRLASSNKTYLRMVAFVVVLYMSFLPASSGYSLSFLLFCGWMQSYDYKESGIRRQAATHPSNETLG